MSEDFSVLMSVYAGDNPHCLVKAVESVIKQTMAPKEVIMVIDGPIGDELKNVIIKIKGQNPSVKVVYLPKNKGLGPALQEGLKECTTDLIARMDSDDISVPDRFEKQLKIFQKEENVDLLGGLIAEFIGSCDNVVGIRSVPETNEEIYHYMKNRCPLNHVTVMFRKESVLSVGGYRSWPYNEDYDLWIRMALAGKTFRNINDVLVNVRVGREMYKRRGGITYFKSEYEIQNLMRRNNMISQYRFLYNVVIRVIVQILLPNKVRGIVFRMFARKRF